MAVTLNLDLDVLRGAIRHEYEQVATCPTRGFHFHTGRPLAERLGYPAADIAGVPAGSLESFAGVGNPYVFGRMRLGETVLDVGSGAGLDSLIAARQVGPTGRVIGVDMTDAQLAKARRLADEHGFTGVEFRKGYIEQPPVDPDSCDCIVSNGVINLSPDKPAVFAAAAAALRTGGRLALADIVTAQQLPEGVTCDAALWAACIGGAMQRDHYRAAIENAGFEIETWRENAEYRFVSTRADNATRKYGVTSISLLARRR